MEIRRGEIYLVDFDLQKGEEKKPRPKSSKRPAVVLTRNAFNKERKTVVVVPLSSSPRAAPPLVIAVPSAGRNSVAICDQVTTINKATRIIRSIGTPAPGDMHAVEDAVREVLAL